MRLAAVLCLLAVLPAFYGADGASAAEQRRYHTVSRQVGAVPVPLLVDEQLCGRFDADDAAPIYDPTGAVVGHVTLCADGPLDADGLGSMHLDIQLTAPELHFAAPRAPKGPSTIPSGASAPQPAQPAAAGNVVVSLSTLYPNGCPASSTPIKRTSAAVPCGARSASLRVPVPGQLFYCTSESEPMSRNFFMQVEVAVAPSACSPPAQRLYAGAPANQLNVSCSFIMVTGTCAPASCTTADMAAMPGAATGWHFSTSHLLALVWGSRAKAVGPSIMLSAARLLAGEGSTLEKHGSRTAVVGAAVAGVVLVVACTLYFQRRGLARSARTSTARAKVGHLNGGLGRSSSSRAVVRACGGDASDEGSEGMSYGVLASPNRACRIRFASTPGMVAESSSSTSTALARFSSKHRPIVAPPRMLTTKDMLPSFGSSNPRSPNSVSGLGSTFPSPSYGTSAHSSPGTSCNGSFSRGLLTAGSRGDSHHRHAAGRISRSYNGSAEQLHREDGMPRPHMMSPFMAYAAEGAAAGALPRPHRMSEGFPAASSPYGQLPSGRCSDFGSSYPCSGSSSDASRARRNSLTHSGEMQAQASAPCAPSSTYSARADDAAALRATRSAGQGALQGAGALGRQFSQGSSSSGRAVAYPPPPGMPLPPVGPTPEARRSGPGGWLPSPPSPFAYGSAVAAGGAPSRGGSLRAAASPGLPPLGSPPIPSQAGAPSRRRGEGPDRIPNPHALAQAYPHAGNDAHRRGHHVEGARRSVPGTGSSSRQVAGAPYAFSMMQVPNPCAGGGMPPSPSMRRSSPGELLHSAHSMPAAPSSNRPSHPPLHHSASSEWPVPAAPAPSCNNSNRSSLSGAMDQGFTFTPPSASTARGGRGEADCTPPRVGTGATSASPLVPRRLSYQTDEV